MGTHDRRTARPTAADAGPATAPAHLVDLLELDEPLLVGFEPTSARLRLHVTPYPSDPRCAAGALFGFVAPDSWCALGVRLHGDARDPGSGERTGARVATTAVVHRDGRVATRLSVDGRVHDDAWDPLAGGRAAARGLVLDALHRALGRATPGDPPPAWELAVALWCDAVLARVPAEVDLRWADVVAVHPGHPGHAPVVASHETVAEATHRCARGLDWTRLHRRAVRDGLPSAGLAPEEVAWMDATMYARWALGSLPDGPRTVEVLRAHHHLEAAHGLERVLRLLRPGDDDAAGSGG
jgi:hypothetical protein